MPAPDPIASFRLFIALPLPVQVKDRLEAAQQHLRHAIKAATIRWTLREQLHLTFKFLGNVEPRRTEALIEAMRRTCLPFAPLRLQAGCIGFFPSSRRPRVVWAGVRDVGEHLLDLQRAIELAASEFTSEPTEKKFAAHITLGRIKEIRHAEADALARLASDLTAEPFGEWTANTVELLRSKLSVQGAMYETLASIPLAHSAR